MPGARSTPTTLALPTTSSSPGKEAALIVTSPLERSMSSLPAAARSTSTGRLVQGCGEGGNGRERLVGRFEVRAVLALELKSLDRGRGVALDAIELLERGVLIVDALDQERRGAQAGDFLREFPALEVPCSQTSAQPKKAASTLSW